MLVSTYLLISLLLLVNNLVSCLNSDYNIKSDANSEDGQLIFAHILFRHGDRTPIDPYPTDPYKGRQNWPEGFGQLTNIGKEQHYELGKYFRQRYEKLIGDGTYLADKIYVQSTDVDRTLMSVESNLAGFFPPSDSQIWNGDLLWQPIPIHTIPERLDYVLAGKKPCARYNHAMKKYEDSPEFKALLKKFRPLFLYLEQNSGKPMNTINDIQWLYNTLWIEQLKNKTLPEWTKNVFFDGSDFQWISDFSFKVDTITPELARLKSGFLLREILARFTNKTESKLTPDRSLWMYSAHDTTVANILNSLGLFPNPHNPPYAATVLFELYEQNGNHYVQIFYKNTTDENIPPLYIPDCGQKCPLEKFSEIYKSIIPTLDFEAECRLSLFSLTYEEAEFSPYQSSSIAMVCISLAGALIVFTAFMYLVRERERNPKRYVKL